MSTRFQVKRSTVSGVTPTTGDIAAGELAVNLPDRKLFTSNGSAISELGSNLTSLSVGNTTTVQISNSSGLFVNGNIGIGTTAPNARLAVTGTANISGNVVIGGSLNAANVTATVFTGALTGTASNATNLNSQPGSFYTNATNLSTGTLNTARLPATANIATAVNVGANVNLTTSIINVGNSTVNVSINSTSITVTSDPLVQQSDIGTAPDQVPLNQYLGTLAYQSDAIAVSNLFAIGNTAVFTSTGNVGIGNTSPVHRLRVEGDVSFSSGIHANGSLGTAGQVLHSNGTVAYWDTDDQGVTSVASGNGLTGGTITSTGTLSVLANSGIVSNTTGVFVNANAGLIANTTGLHVGAGNGIGVNSTAVAVIANSGIIANSTGVFVNASSIAVGTVPTARLGSGAANSTTFLAGDQTYKSAVTSVATGNGLIGGTITTTGTVSVLANSGLIANATGLHVGSGSGITTNSTTVAVLANNGLSANATGVYVIPGNGIVTANSTGVHVGAGSGISVNSTAVAVLANNGIIANSTGTFVLANSGLVANATGLHVGAGNGITTNLTAVAVLANNGISANATGVYVIPGNGIVTSNSTGVHVGAGNGISVNTTAVAVLANTGIVANATGVYVNSAYIATIAANSATGSLTNTFTVGTAAYFVANGNVGIGVTTPTAKLDIAGTNIPLFESVTTDNVGDQALTAHYLDVNMTGTDTLTANREHNAFRIDVDATATGGNTTNQHLVRGIYNTVDVTGTSSQIYGIDNRVRTLISSGTVSAIYGALNACSPDPGVGGTVTSAFGSLNQAYAGGAGFVDTIYGSRNEAVLEVTATGGVVDAYGALNEIEIDGNTLTNGYATRSVMNIDGGVTTNAYLYYGDYQGANATNVLNSWGIFLSGATKNYISGNVGINNTAPNATLAVTGTANVSGNVVIGGSLNAANVTATVFTGALTGTASNATNLGGIAAASYVQNTDSRTLSGTLTFSNNVILTRASGLQTGNGQIYLNGATGNRIDFNTSGVAAPTTTTRSAGTKIVLYPGVSATNVDYALGIEGNVLWYSVPGTTQTHRWYGGTSQWMNLTTSGLAVNNGITANTISVGNSTVNVSVNSTSITVTSDPLVQQSDIGTAPDQVPLNQYLGTLAYQSDTIAVSNTFTIGSAAVFAANGNVGIGTTAPGALLNVVANTATDALRITQTGAGNALVVEDSANPDSTPFVVDTNGRVISGALSAYNISSVTPKYQAQTNSVFDGGFGGFSWENSSQAQISVWGKSRSGTIGTQTIVQSGDNIADLRFAGSDGTTFIEAAKIVAAIDGTPGTNDMPGRLVFSTTADGASTPTERMRITSTGNVGIGASAPGARLSVISSANTNDGIFYTNSNTGTSAQAVVSINTQGALGLQLGQNYTSKNAFIYLADAAALTLSTNAIARMTIAANGNVGINNTAPNATLAVTGTANVSGNAVIGGSLNAANVTATIFTGALTGTASNATNLNSQPGSFYTNATNISTGTLNTARLPATANITTAINIGTNTNITPTEMSINGSAVTTGFGPGSGYVVTSYGSNDISYVTRKAGGTVASPSATPINGRLGFLIGASTNDGTTFLNTAAIEMYAEAAANSTSHPTALRFSTTAAGSTSRTERALISSSGQFRIAAGNTSAPAYSVLTDTNTGMFFPAVDTIAFAGGGVEVLRINSVGNTGIGTSSPSEKLHVVGNIVATGDITTNFSDERLKDRVDSIDSALSIVQSLTGFKYKNNELAGRFGYTDTDVRIGLSAQEVQRVLPELVKPAPFDIKIDDGGERESLSGSNYLTVDYMRLVPVLIEAIKAQQDQIELLKQQVNELRSR